MAHGRRVPSRGLYCLSGYFFKPLCPLGAGATTWRATAASEAAFMPPGVQTAPPAAYAPTGALRGFGIAREYVVTITFAGFVLRPKSRFALVWKFTPLL